MDFKQFCDSNVEKQNNRIKSEKVDIDKEKVNSFEDIVDKVKKMKPNEMLNEFFRTANDLKSRGKLDSEQLKHIENILYPMLNLEQRDRITELINMIK